MNKEIFRRKEVSHEKEVCRQSLKSNLLKIPLLRDDFGLIISGAYVLRFAAQDHAGNLTEDGPTPNLPEGPRISANQVHKT